MTAVLRGARPGPAVLPRADTDALPMHEKADVPCRSRFDGRKHACGRARPCLWEPPGRSLLAEPAIRGPARP